MSQSIFDAIQLPVLQARTKCVLIARDPNYVYAYWDYTQEDIAHACDQLKAEGENLNLTLRIYDITAIQFNGSNANYSWDIDVGFSGKNRLVEVWQDHADYCAELGIKTLKNNFITLVRSNTVQTPSKTTLKRDDLIWQDIKPHKRSSPYLKEDINLRNPKLKQSLPVRIYHLSAQEIRTYYRKILSQISTKSKTHPSMRDILKHQWKGIFWQKVSSLVENQDMIKRAHPGASAMLLEKGQAHHKSFGVSPIGSSENLFSASLGASEGRLKSRKFFFEIWTELIVHGRTEPDAGVWLNQKGIKLNPDGTFSLRYALPDGEIPLKFIAESSDGMEQRHINTGVERQITIGFPKMLRDPNA